MLKYIYDEVFDRENTQDNNTRRSEPLNVSNTRKQTAKKKRKK